MAERVITVPSYMLGFQCQMCGECCIGWKIVVEKPLYKEIKNLFVTKKLHLGRFEDFFQKEPHPKFGGKIDYGFIKFSDKGRCKLLEGNLCCIHKDIGPEYLPGVCKAFPRVIISTPRGLEFALTPGCRNAARTFLNKDKAKVAFNPPDFNFTIGCLIWDYITNEQLNKNEITKNYFLLEEHFIEILQNRSFTIEERVIFLGLTIKEIISLVQDSNFKTKLEKLIETNRTVLTGNSFIGEVRKLGLNMEYQLIALKNFLNLKLYETCSDPEVVQSINNCAEKLLSGEMKENITTYRRMYHYYMRPAAGEVAHVFENYLVNFVQRKMFILYTLEDAFYILAFFYVIIRAVTLNLAFEKNEVVSQEDVVKAIYLIEKSLGHNKAYDGALIQLKDQNRSDISHAIGLIRI